VKRSQRAIGDPQAGKAQPAELHEVCEGMERWKGKLLRETAFETKRVEMREASEAIDIHIVTAIEQHELAQIKQALDACERLQLRAARDG